MFLVLLVLAVSCFLLCYLFEVACRDETGVIKGALSLLGAMISMWVFIGASVVIALYLLVS